jgi:hypothetical protein
MLSISRSRLGTQRFGWWCFNWTSQSSRPNLRDKTLAASTAKTGDLPRESDLDGRSWLVWAVRNVFLP